MPDNIVQFHDLGGISYADAWDYQTLLNADLIGAKRRSGDIDDYPYDQRGGLHHLLFCEHNHVYTLGKSGSEDHLVAEKSALEDMGIEYFRINRGGDITYHGKGQITGYLIFDLERFYRDVHRFVRNIEESIIEFLKLYNLEGERVVGYTGVWLRGNNGLRKICAIGVHLSRWVSMHGFALNINTDVAYYNNIIPCGIAENDKSVTSLQLELGREVDLSLVKNQVKKCISHVFEVSYLSQ